MDLIRLGGSDKLDATLKTSIGLGVNINASSSLSNGGKVVIYSDGFTQQYGSIIATGNLNGGLVNISGKQGLKSYKLSNISVAGNI